MSSKGCTIQQSYERITPFFYWLSRLFESRARARSLEMSEIRNGGSILVIAPPTEFYLDKLLGLNSEGENHLIYFSEQMKQRAEERLRGRYSYAANLGNLGGLPYENDKFDVIFAYCYLDFLGPEETKTAVEETRRVLRSGGRLLATYLASPGNLIETAAASFFTRFDCLSGGLRVVEVKPALEQAGFRNIEILPCPQKCLPVGLACAVK